MTRCTCPRYNKSQKCPIHGQDLKTMEHPCKNTCSGWKQGYEQGEMEATTKLEQKIRPIYETQINTLKLKHEENDLRWQALTTYLENKNQKLREWITKANHRDKCKHRYDKNECDCGRDQLISDWDNELDTESQM